MANLMLGTRKAFSINDYDYSNYFSTQIQGTGHSNKGWSVTKIGWLEPYYNSITCIITPKINFTATIKIDAIGQYEYPHPVSPGDISFCFDMGRRYGRYELVGSTTEDESSTNTDHVSYDKSHIIDFKTGVPLEFTLNCYKEKKAREEDYYHYYYNVSFSFSNLNINYNGYTYQTEHTYNNVPVIPTKQIYIGNENNLPTPAKAIYYGDENNTPVKIWTPSN